jgi:hypothetical protein
MVERGGDPVLRRRLTLSPGVEEQLRVGERHGPGCLRDGDGLGEDGDGGGELAGVEVDVTE